MIDGYTWGTGVDLSSVDYSCPDGHTISQLRVDTAGVVIVDLPQASKLPVPVAAYDILNLRILKIYKQGTTSSGVICVLGD